MDLKDIMLSDMGQTENDKYIISHICGSKKNPDQTKPNKTLDIESRLVVARGNMMVEWGQ